MTIKKLQKIIEKIDKIILKKMGNFSYPNLIRCLKAQEELGEIADILIRMEVGSRKGRMKINKGRFQLGKEIADTITPLVAIATDYHIDLENIFIYKLKKDIKRYKGRRILINNQ